MAKISFWVRIIAASLAAVVMSTSLSGCSAIKLGYNQLPEISSWWLDNYVNFIDNQSTQAKQALKKLQAWHRKEELPLVVDLLVQAQSMASNNVSPQQACEVWGKLEKRIDWRESIPKLPKFALGHTHRAATDTPPTASFGKTMGA